MTILTIARLTVAEARRRRILWVLLALTLVSVALTTWGVERLVTFARDDGTGELEIQVGISQVLILVAFMFSFVLAMTADHLREIVVAHPFLLGRATTLGGAAHASAAGADLVRQRTGKEVLATPRHDDIDDPVGRPGRVQREIARRLVDTCAALARTWPVAR